MPDETRIEFRRELEEIDQKVIQLFALVSEGVAAATELLGEARDVSGRGEYTGVSGDAAHHVRVLVVHLAL